MNREMRRLMEREERIQKRDKDNGPQRRLPGPARGGQAVERKPIWQRLITFLHEVRLELKKVAWPSREQLLAFTAVTLVVATTLALVVFALDVGMKEAVFTLLQRR